MAESDDQCLSTIGGITAGFRGRRGIAAKTSINGCGVPGRSGGVSRGRSASCRRTRSRYVHSLRILSSTGIIRKASALAGRIVVGARSLTLISVFLAFMEWDG